MDILKKYVYPALLLLLIVLLVIMGWLYSRSNDKYLREKSLNEIREFVKIQELRKLNRLKEDEAFNYRDSLRTERINNQKQKIKANHDKTNKAIADLRSDSTIESRTNIWTEDWYRKEGQLFSDAPF